MRGAEGAGGRRDGRHVTPGDARESLLPAVIDLRLTQTPKAATASGTDGDVCERPAEVCGVTSGKRGLPVPLLPPRVVHDSDLAVDDLVRRAASTCDAESRKSWQVARERRRLPVNGAEAAEVDRDVLALRETELAQEGLELPESRPSRILDHDEGPHLPGGTKHSSSEDSQRLRDSEAVGAGTPWFRLRPVGARRREDDEPDAPFTDPAEHLPGDALVGEVEALTIERVKRAHHTKTDRNERARGPCAPAKDLEAELALRHVAK